MRARLLGLALTALAAGSLSAATFTVTNTNDSGAGSLRQAITDANAAVGPRHDCLQRVRRRLRRRGRLHDHPGEPAAERQQSRPHRRLHAARRSAEYECRGSAQHGAEDRVVGSDHTGHRPPVHHGRRRIDRPRSGLERRLELRNRVRLRRHRRVRSRLLHRHRRRGDGGAEPAQHPRDRLEFSPGLTAGGPSPADRNLVSGNAQSGITCYHVGEPAHPGQSRRHRQVGDAPCSAASPFWESASKRRHPAR